MRRVLRPFMQCSRPPTRYAAWPRLRVWIEQRDTDEVDEGQGRRRV